MSREDRHKAAEEAGRGEASLAWKGHKEQLRQRERSLLDQQYARVQESLGANNREIVDAAFARIRDEVNEYDVGWELPDDRNVTSTDAADREAPDEPELEPGR